MTKGYVFNKKLTGLLDLRIIYEAPVTLETPGTRGLSHLIEHMVCDSYNDLEDIYMLIAA